MSIDYFFKEFSNISPGWVRGLLRLRNFLVRFIGLKHDYPEVPVAKDQRIEAGCKVGMFNIVQRNENEIVFGEDDKHLEFRSSLLLDSQNDKHVLYSITIVHFHNITGKIYFFFVKPFHRSIVKSFMKQLIKRAQET
ncbi:MAG: DUF2867 domain-containing protein [Bacteroidales bacterium]|nr:DUF2867 domain-containing protein [Bacteroidales bacterium]